MPEHMVAAGLLSPAGTAAGAAAAGEVYAGLLECLARWIACGKPGVRACACLCAPGSREGREGEILLACKL